MDMSVSQVNSRLYTRLPLDTGLGLLFATGTVSQIIYAGGERPILFTLRHAGYALRCKISPDLEPDFALRAGQWVRVTGHIGFSAQSAQFYLLARDLELLSDLAPTRLGVAPKRAPTGARRDAVPGWLTEVQMRAVGPADGLAPAEVPDWVQAMAPREFAVRDGGQKVSWGRQRVERLYTQPDAPEIDIQGNEKLWSHLLVALERSEHEDVELTAETLVQFTAPAGAEPDEGPQNSNPAPVQASAQAEADSPLTKPYGQLFLLFMLAIVLGVVFFLLYSLSQRGLL